MATFTVTSTADTGSGSLRQAVANAQDGDVILFDDDIFPSNQTTAILLSSHIAINKQLTIDAGANGTTSRVALDAQNNSRCLYLQPGAGGTLRGLLFCNASNDSNGGAVYCAATNPITFTQCRFRNNTGNTGGGLSTTVAATLTFDSCEFSGNTANSNGGAVYCSSAATLTFDDCTFSGNTANSNGGGFLATSTSQNTLNNCVFSGNSAGVSGGGLYSVSMSQNTLNDCIFTNNTAQSLGNAVRSDSTSRVAIINCEIHDNTSGDDDSTTDVSAGGTSVVSVASSRINGVSLGATATLDVDAGITTCVALYLNRSGDNATIVTFADGAALAVTTAATIPTGTAFTSETRGYLATATGLDFSAATLTNVVVCTYGAGLESFDIDADGASWTAENIETPILIETRNNTGEWDTLTTQASGGAYATSFSTGTTARAFDGVKFFRAEISAYWQVTAWAAATNGAGTISGGDAAADSWSVTPITITPNLNEA